MHSLSLSGERRGLLFFTAGAGGGAGIDFLAFRRGQRHDAGDSARHATSAAAGREGPFLLPAAGLLRLLLQFLVFYTAAARINTGLESVIFSMAVLFNAINSFLFFRQQPPGRFWAAAALGLAGIVTLFWDDLLANGLNATLPWGSV